MSKDNFVKDILQTVNTVAGFGNAMESIFGKDEVHIRKNFRLIWKYYRRTYKKLKKGGLTPEEITELKEIKSTVRKALNKLA